MITSVTRSFFKLNLITSALLLLSGCASVPREVATPGDPLESFNRGVYSFNDTVDKAVLKPVATGYEAIVPQVLRTGVSNFFANLNYPTVVINDVLQGKLSQAGSDMLRFITNSTLGLGGIWDIAAPLGLPAHDEDFGQTLGTWGTGEGFYLVLPLLGPSTFRDATGLIPDYYTDLLTYVDDVSVRNSLRGLKLVDARARLLKAGRILDQAALDPYVFTRDAYLQRRANLIQDGGAALDDEFLDEETEDDTGEDVEQTPASKSAPSESPTSATRDNAPPTERLPGQ